MQGSLEQDVLQEQQIEPQEVEAQDQNIPEQEVVKPAEKPQEDFQDKNWRAARLKLEEQSRALQAMGRELEYLRELRAREAPAQEPAEDDSDFTDTERRLYQEIKALKGEVSKSRVRESDITIDRLRLKFPDFDAVMDPENISFLKTNNPSLAKALASLKDDPYEQGLAAYEALKNTSWYQGNKNTEEKMKLDQNVKKPLSVQAVRKQGALSEANRFANGLTPELKKALVKEMAEARKGS